ncbi:MAG: hypothetical protein GY867_06625 [bacterium]|nr:hypothetical protein [bacterium]
MRDELNGMCFRFDKGTPCGDSFADRVLYLANSGIPRVDFLREISQLLMESTRSSAIEMWVEEDGDCARCRAAAVSDTEPRFGFRLTECPRRTDSHRSQEPLLCRISGPASHPVLDDIARSVLGGPQLVSFALMPLMVGQEPTGWVLLMSDQAGFFSDDRVASFKETTQTVSIALINQRNQAALRERVKELTGLYEIDRLAERPDISLDELLHGAVRLLPPTWQYPEITVAKIVLDERSYLSGEACHSPWVQRSEIVVDTQQRGYVEVSYTEEKPLLFEGPFLREERSLLDAFAREIAAFIVRRQAAAERVHLQEQLLHADRLATIGQLAAGVAHELNEPLGAVLGFAQLARKHGDLAAPVDADISKIETASLHARQIIKKLMMFARQTPPCMGPVNLNQSLDDCMMFFEARCAKRQIEVVRSYTSDLPEIIADSSQLQQVAANLVVNAIQAMPDGGRLTLATAESGSKVVLRVADTGPGMSSEVMEKIFVPFFTTKDVNQGTGLGLAVTHGIVMVHGGTIRVESEEGVGSCFEVEFLQSMIDPDEATCGRH